jgi:hypothetical protein
MVAHRRAITISVVLLLGSLACGGVSSAPVSDGGGDIPDGAAPADGASTPDAGRFACPPVRPGTPVGLTCAAGTEYCHDSNGVRADYTCRPIPPACAGDHSCRCIAPPATPGNCATCTDTDGFVSVSEGCG